MALAMGVLVAWPGVAGAANKTVYERGIQFDEPQVDVAVGESVTWIYESSPGNAGHSVTFEDPTLNDTRFQNCPGFVLNDCQRSPSDRVVRTFRRVGNFPYYCKVHRAEGMTGVVVVSAVTSTTSPSTTSSTLPRATTTSSTAKGSTSSTTATTRQLATSSTLVKSTTTTANTTSVLLPGDAPAFPGDDANSAAGQSGGSDDGSDSGTVVLIVGLLLAVAVGGGYLLWRLRPGRA
jgi:plastocyanin